MSQERQVQWRRRLDRLHGLKERLAARGHYDRARKAYLLIQACVDRWSHEVFSAKQANQAEC
jgi:hypothetical protein